MKISYFETGRYHAPGNMPRAWPAPPEVYDREAGARAYRGMIERVRFIEELGFDWVSLSEHHYSPHRLTPAPVVSAAHVVATSQKITIAVLGPIVSQSNPVQVAENLAMLDNLAPGRLVVGMLRGTTGEYLSYGLNPTEARERTTEAMELVLKAWTEPQPFGWQGRHYQFRTVSVWPRPTRQPHPPTYALGSSRESCEFAARHRLGLGVSYAPFDVVARVTRHYRERCAHHGWEPTPEQIIYRANIIVAASDDEAQSLLEAQRRARAPFPLQAGVRDALIELDSRNVAGEARTPNVGGMLPTNFIGGPDAIVEQIERCGAETGVGVIDLLFQTPGAGDTGSLMASLELFGKQVLPRIREV
ncbi:MAG TPA: LLM class flavin-dependent oxidoreductase [Stellaceae bacterium]|jgi:alkanesulfonate monooxygenase SsuD/methylene tetrahydromethanopterin reductase-like flavin-dependent oxidoreductase (luciferase family)